MRAPIGLRPTPNLGDDQVMRALCGLRPCRHGGLRLSSESIGSKRIVHNYGHGGCGVTTSFGTAQIACDMVEQEAAPGTAVAVLGAGVVGLVTARELAGRGYRVTVYAQRVARETTSVLAGAIWLPVGIEFGTTREELDRKGRILARSRAAFRELDADRYGIEEIEVYEPSGAHTEEGLFEAGLIEEPVEIDAFPFACPTPAGRVFTTAYIHTPMFLDAIVADLDALGVEIVHRRFDEAGELEALDEAVIVNCLALGSRALFNDRQMYAARGVLVHLKPQDLGYCVHDGYKYMFPRRDALVLGGCFQPDRWDDTPDDAMVEEILNHHRRFFGQA